MASERMIRDDEKSKEIFLLYVGLEAVIPASVWTVPALKRPSTGMSNIDQI
jgi:hypothetical protein